MDPAATRRVARGAAVKALAHFKAQRRFEKPAAFGLPARSRETPRKPGGFLAAFPKPRLREKLWPSPEPFPD